MHGFGHDDKIGDASNFDFVNLVSWSFLSLQEAPLYKQKTS